MLFSYHGEVVCQKRASPRKIQQIRAIAHPPFTLVFNDSVSGEPETGDGLEKWEPNLDQLSVSGFFNFGREADVIFCQNRRKKVPNFCALKIRSISDSDSHFEEILNEVELVQMHPHENIAGVYCAAVVSRDVLGLVMPPYLGLKLLLDLTKETRHENSPDMVINEVLARQLVHQTLKGLSFLHSIGFIHRSLNLSCLMLSDDGNLKISGFSRLLQFQVAADPLGKNSKPFRPTSSQYFECAPEMFVPGILNHPEMFPEADRSDEYDIRVDSWSLGYAILYMLFGQRPFTRANDVRTPDTSVETENVEVQLRDWVTRYCDKEAEWRCWFDIFGKRGQTLQKMVTPEFQKFIKDCMRINKLKRWTCDQLLKHPWMKMKHFPGADGDQADIAPENRDLIKEKFLNDDFLGRMDDVVASMSENVVQTPDDVRVGEQECLITVMTIIKKERYMVRFVVSTRWLKFPKRKLEQVVRTKLLPFAESNLLRITEYIKLTAVTVHLVDKFREDEENNKFIYRCFVVRNSAANPNFDTLDEMGMVMISSNLKYSDKVCRSKWPGRELEMDKRFIIQMSELEKGRNKGIFERMRDRVINKKKRNDETDKALPSSRQEESDHYQTAPEDQLHINNSGGEQLCEQKKKSRLKQRLRNLFTTSYSQKTYRL